MKNWSKIINNLNLGFCVEKQSEMNSTKARARCDGHKVHSFFVEAAAAHPSEICKV